jgi:hypothetical protein
MKKIQREFLFTWDVTTSNIGAAEIPARPSRSVF